MKNFKKVLLAAGLLLLVLSVYKCTNDGSESPAVLEAKLSQNYINPPIPELNLAYTEFKIQPQQESTLKTTSGAVIHIPKNAFLDQNGNPVLEEVDLSFRDFYHPLEFYLAGIPMTYMVNGEEMVFESAGMFELNATSNGQELFVNPENKISVDLVSWSDSTEFNVYHYDTISGNWMDQGKDSLSISNRQDELDQLPIIPQKPKVATPYSFKLIDDTNNFPEISQFENVLFEPFDYSKCAISDALEMQVNLLENGVFEVVSRIFNQENRCLCYMAFEKGAQYDAALQIYQEKYADLINEREQRFNEIQSQWDYYNELLRDLQNRQIQQLSGEEKIMRTMTVNNFGFTNCDYPSSYPSGGILSPIYVDKDNNPILLKEVVLVEENTNALFRYEKEVKYNPEKENILWGMTSDNKLAYLTRMDFKNLPNSNNEQTVVMNLMDTEGLNYDDLISVLFD